MAEKEKKGRQPKWRTICMMKRNSHLYYAEYSVIIRLKSCRWFSAAFHHRCAVLAHICHPARHFNMLTCIHGFIRVAFWKCIETNRAAFKWDTRAAISKMKLFDERIFSTNLSHKLEKQEHEAMKKNTRRFVLMKNALWQMKLRVFIS